MLFYVLPSIISGARLRKDKRRKENETQRAHIVVCVACRSLLIGEKGKKH